MWSSAIKLLILFPALLMRQYRMIQPQVKMVPIALGSQDIRRVSEALLSRWFGMMGFED
jgi:hypothetical protein